METVSSPAARAGGADDQKRLKVNIAKSVVTTTLNRARRPRMPNQSAIFDMSVGVVIGLESEDVVGQRYAVVL